MNETQTDFLFLGGALALDLVNTQVVVRGKRDDLLKTTHDLSRWWELAQNQYPLANIFLAGENEFRPELLQALKDLRTTLRSIFQSIARHENLNDADREALNRVLGSGSPTLLTNSNGEIRGGYKLQLPEKEQILFQIALSAYRLLTENDLERLHKCRNERCVLYFYDTTKSATRHWCSLGCMNRARSIQHYQKSKEISGASSAQNI